jgi:aspartate aminotransferase
MEFAARVRNLAPSATMLVWLRARELAAQGRDIIDLTAGELNVDSPEVAAEAAAAALHRGAQRLTSPGGLPRLREAVAARNVARHGLNVASENVVITTGGKFALYLACQALLGAGDEAVIVAPYWSSYPALVELAGARPVIHDTTACGFRLRPERLAALVTPRTKMVILNSPNNPTGAVYTREELAEVAAVAAERGLWIVSDEIYEHHVYDGREHVCLAALPEADADRVVTVSGFSKSHAMTGWRLGWLVAERRVTERIVRLQGHATSGPAHFAQAGAVAALEKGDGFIEDVRASLEVRRDLVRRCLAAFPELQVAPMEGAFYAWLNPRAFFNSVAPSAVALADLLLEQSGVALVPGSAFGARDWLRLSYAVPEERLAVALDRLAEFLAEK